MEVQKRSRLVDTELIKKVQQGDAGSFDKLYKDYYAYVFRICYEYFRNTSKAEDMVQETFILVYRNIHSLATPESFVNWLNRIAYNCCTASYKKEKRDASGYINEKEENYVENLEIKSHDKDHLSKMELQYAKKIVEETLQQMKPENRLIGYLRFFEELSYSEICDVTTLSMGTVSIKIKRIKENLQKALEKKNISKECLLSVILTPNLISIYQDYVKSFPQPEIKTSQNIISSLSNNTKKTFLKSVPQLMGIVLSVAIPTTVITYQYVQDNQLGGHDEIANITKIQYNHELTNHDIPIYIEFNNEAYDEVLLDGKKSMKVSQNGEHIVEVFLDGKKIDQKTFEVNNIDKQSPLVQEHETADAVVLELSDDHGVDYNKTKMYVNGELSDDILIDKEEGTIKISKDIHKRVAVSIVDLAGNELNVNVSFYKVFV